MNKLFAVSVLALALGACAQAPNEPAPGHTAMTADRAAPALDKATLSAYGWRLTEAVDRHGQPVEALRAVGDSGGVGTAEMRIFAPGEIPARK